MIKVKFKDINFNDPFFDSLKADYDFEKWIKKKIKQDEEAFVLYEDERIIGWFYLKQEQILKIGSFKFLPNQHHYGTKAMNEILKTPQDVYITVFEKHQNLIQFLKKFNFKEEKRNGNEIYFRHYFALNPTSIC